MSKLFCSHSAQRSHEIRLIRYECMNCKKIHYKEIVEQEEYISNKKVAKILEEFNEVVE